MRDNTKTVSITTEGAVSVTENGNSVFAVSEKSLHVELSAMVQSVGIENLIDVEIHEINKLFGSISHYIRFVNGGEVKFSYNSAGKLLELSGKGVLASIQDGDRISFAMAV